MRTRNAFAAVIFLALTGFGPHGENTMVKDYLSVPGPLAFDGAQFKLAWSSHPSDVYYKHEYLTEGENPEHFNRMLMLEAVTGTLTVNDAINSMVQNLEQRKQTDPTVNYQVFDNKKTGERMIDFILSESNDSGVSITEWNVYRYVNLKNVAGVDGVLLFAYSKRAYEDDILPFLKNLASTRTGDMQKVVDFKLPEITFAE